MRVLVLKCSTHTLVATSSGVAVWLKHPQSRGVTGIRDAMAKEKHHEPWFGVDDLGEFWKLAWDTSLGQRHYNKYGVSGWCKLISRSRGGPIEPGLPRVHLCYHNPCEARWKHESKYGVWDFRCMFNL